MTERIVEIRWQDTATAHGWHSGTDPINPSMCRTVGYLIKEDDEAIVVVESMVEAEPDDELQTLKRFGCSTSIPRSAIRKVTELTSRRPSPKRGKR